MNESIKNFPESTLIIDEKYLKFLLLALFAAGMFFLFLIVQQTSSGELTVSSGDEAPLWVNETSVQVCMLNVTAYNNSGGEGNGINWINITVYNSASFDPTDNLSALSNDNSSGVSVYEENGDHDDFQAGEDLRIGTVGAWYGGGPYWNVNVTFGTPVSIPDADPNTPNFYIILRTSAALGNNDKFNVSINASAINSTYGNAPAAYVNSSVTEGDILAPEVPTNFQFSGDGDSGGDTIGPGSGYNDDLIIDLTWTAATDNGTGSGISHYRIGTAWGQTGSTYDEDEDYTVNGDGNYTLYICAVDNVGHNSTEVAMTNWAVCNTTLPEGTINVTELSDTDFLDYDGGSDTLYYANHESSFNISAEFAQWETHEKEVKFGGGFDQVENTDDSETYDSNTYSIAEGNTDTQIAVKLVDMAGNVGYRNLTLVKDTWGPNITSPSASESSNYIFVNGTSIYYGDDMPGAESFSVSGSGEENLSGLWKMEFAGNALGNATTDITPASWSGTYDSVENSDNVVGNLEVTLHDNVNNTATFNFTLARDTAAPTITDGDWNETSSYLYVDNSTDLADNSIYYGDGMGAGLVEGTLTLAFTDDNGLYNVSYSVSAGVDQEIDLISELANTSTAIYSFNNADTFGGAIVIRVTDMCGNFAKDTSTYVITRDTTGPAVDSYAADETSDFLHVDGTTVYYGDNMSAAQGFNLTGTASDGASGLYLTSFAPGDLGAPLDDPSPAAWAGLFGDVGSGDTWTGVITVTFYDMVNNTNTVTFNVTRDIDITGISLVEIYENSDFMFYNAGTETLYYSNNQNMNDDFKIRIQDSEAKSGRNYATSETAFGDTPTDNSYGSYWELQYTINNGESSGGPILVTIYDNCKNGGTFNVNITIDNTAPNVTLSSVSESSDHLYFDNGNVILFYSNDQNMNDEVEIQIQDDENGCGRQKAVGETAFSETPSDNSYSLWWSIAYTISQSETCDGQITITVYDKCDNNATYNLTVTLDNDAPAASVDTIVTTGDNVYFNGSVLFFSNNQTMSDTFEIRVTDDEAGSGRRNASGEAAFGEYHDDNDGYGTYWSLTYTISVSETCDGNFTVTVWDNCGNSNTTNFTVILDNAVPELSNFAHTESPRFSGWGEDWFDPAALPGGTMNFTWTNSDGSSGLGSGEIDWSSSAGNDQLDLNAGTTGSYEISDLGNDLTGNITVTIYIYDNVNNMNTTTITFNFDADSPSNIDIPNINEITNADNIHFDPATDKLYYNNSVEIQFHMVVSFDDTGSGRNQTHGPTLFGDSPTNGTYSAGHYLYYKIEIIRNDAVNNLVITVYDNVGRSTTVTFDLVRDTTSPTVSSTAINEAVNPANMYYNSTSGVFYYNNSVGVPEFDVRVQCSDTESLRDRAQGETRFGDTPLDSVYDNTRYELRYSIEMGQVYNGTINITVYDQVNNWIKTVINVRRDVYAPPTPTNIETDPDGLESFYPYDDDDTVFLYWDFVMDDTGGSDIFNYYSDVNDNTPQTVVTQGHDYHSATAPEGNDTFYVWVADNVGNYCQVGGDWIVVDTGVPTITGITVSSDSAWSYTAGIHAENGGDIWFNSNAAEGAGQTITITFTWTDSYKDKVNVSNVFGGQKFDDFNGGNGWEIPFLVQQGQGNDLALVLWVVDMANNTDTVVINFRVDNDDPAAPTLVVCRPGGPGGTGEYSNSTRIWVTWTNSTGDGAGSGLKEHRMGDDQAPLNVNVSLSGYSDNGTEGLATFYVFAVDKVGNFAWLTDTITIDLHDPVITDLEVDSTKHYFFNESMGTGGGVVWFNSQAGMGAGQIFYVKFQWTEVNKDLIASSPAFGGAASTNNPPWELLYTVPAANGDENLDITVTDLAGRQVFATIQFRVDNQDPLSSGFEIWDNSSSFVYYKSGNNTLYYSGEMPSEQMINISALDVADGLSGVANVTFQAAFSQAEKVVKTGPFFDVYAIMDRDTFEGVLIITIYDNVGNYHNLTINVIRDVTEPAVTAIIVGENSRYLYYDKENRIFYYSDKMAAGQEFYVLFENSTDQESGLYGIYNPTEFDAVANFSSGLPYNLSFVVVSTDNFTGSFAFEIHDMVNNSYVWDMTFVRDTGAPAGSYTIQEDSHYVHYGFNGTLYYGDDMDAGEHFGILVIDEDDNQSGVGGVLFPAAFNLALTDDATIPYSTIYTVGNLSDLTGPLEIIIYDRTYNQFILTLILVRDTTEPSGVIDISDLESHMYYDKEHGTFYYSDKMALIEPFKLGISPVNDTLSGLHKAVFPPLFEKGGVTEDMLTPFEITYGIGSTDHEEGIINISIIDNVGNELVLPLRIVRDTTSPGFGNFTISESSDILYYDGNQNLYYNNENLLSPVELTVEFSNITDDLSGFREVYYPSIFSTLEDFTNITRYTYTLNVSDMSAGAFGFYIYDRVGNVLSVNLTVFRDIESPAIPAILVNESSPYVYYQLIDEHLWYSNIMDSDQQFELSILNISDGISGISRIEIPEMFGVSKAILEIPTDNITSIYIVRPGETIHGSRAVRIYDNVNNSIQVILRISLDTEISLVTSKIAVETKSDRIHYNETNRILYYGVIPDSENFSVEFRLGAINETGAGFRSIDGPDLFTVFPLSDTFFSYLVKNGDADEGIYDFLVYDAVNNMAKFTISVKFDNVKPTGNFTIDGKEHERFSRTKDLNMEIKFTLDDQFSGVKAFYISNDGNSWKTIDLDNEMMKGTEDWDISDKLFGGNRSENNRKIYFKIVDKVANERTYEVQYDYIAPVEIGLMERLPFVFGVLGFFGAWGFVAVGILLVGMFLFIGRRRRKQEPGPGKEMEGEVIVAVEMEPVPAEPLAEYDGGVGREPATPMEYPWAAGEDETYFEPEEEAYATAAWDEGTPVIDAEVEYIPPVKEREERSDELFHAEEVDEPVEFGGDAETFDRGASWDENTEMANKVRTMDEEWGGTSQDTEEYVHEMQEEEITGGEVMDAEWGVANQDTEEYTGEEQADVTEDEVIDAEWGKETSVGTHEWGVEPSWGDDDETDDIQEGTDARWEDETDDLVDAVIEGVDEGEKEVRAETETGIDRTVDDIIGLLGGQEKEDGSEVPVVNPSLLRITKPTLCVGCKRIIKKNLSGLRCPNCSKVLHMECGKGREECPECGARFG